MMEREAIKAFADLAFSYAGKRIADVEAQGLKMAHYTTAECAAIILQNRTLWLRNATLMNDFSEITHGSECLQHSLKIGLGMRLEAALDTIHPGLFNQCMKRVDGGNAHTRMHTYITSLSAHRPDDLLGKLSMWRAYGGPTSGVAIIFNTEVFGTDNFQFGAYSSPVLYGGVSEFSQEFLHLIENIEKNQELLARIPFDTAAAIMFNALQFSTLSTKHPGFKEEQEWRIIHHPLTEPSAFIPTTIQTVRGIPQMICELQLKDQPGLDMPEIDLDRLLYRIIVGPCVHPQQVAWAFLEILRQQGISKPDERITIANIPLRQRG